MSGEQTEPKVWGQELSPVFPRGKLKLDKVVDDISKASNGDLKKVSPDGYKMLMDFVSVGRSATLTFMTLSMPNRLQWRI